MHRDLLDALSTGWIASTLGVSRAAVADWRRGKFPTRRRIQLAEAVLALVEDTEKTPPPWARAMEQRIRLELRLNRAIMELADPEELERMRAELHGETLDEPPHDGGGQQGGLHPRGGQLGTPL